MSDMAYKAAPHFFYQCKEMPHTDPGLCYADTVSITFEFQKNDERDVTTTKHCTGNAVLCPVICWADLVQCILSYEAPLPRHLLG